MDMKPITTSPKNALGVIALFVGVVEFAFAYPVTILSGTNQTVLISFMVGFPLVVLGAFLFLLMRFPETLYSPSDFNDPKAFSQLITRRDKQLQQQLRSAETQRDALIRSVQDAVSFISAKQTQIATELNGIAELDRNVFNIELPRLVNTLQEADRIFGDRLLRQIELYSHHHLSGIRGVAFDFTGGASSRVREVSYWELDELLDVALAAMSDVYSKSNGALSRQEGHVEFVDGGDNVCPFTYVFTPTTKQAKASLFLTLGHVFNKHA